MDVEVDVGVGELHIRTHTAMLHPPIYDGVFDAVGHKLRVTEKVRIDGFDFGGGNLKVDEDEPEETEADETTEDEDIIVDEDVSSDGESEESEDLEVTEDDTDISEAQDVEYESEDEKKDNDEN